MSDAEEHLTPHDEDMLRISPRNVIVLSKLEDSTDEDLIGTVEITCTSKYPITYKIKTTSPLKFRVRPSAGALNPGSTVSINVILQPGKQVSSANKDKFLVMCTALPDDVDINNSQFITDFWKGLPPNSPNVQQHRLQCVNSQAGGLLRNGQMHGSDEFGDKNCSNNEVAQLSNNVRRLERQMKLSINLHWISLLVFIIVSIALTYILKQEIQEQNQGSCSKFK